MQHGESFDVEDARRELEAVVDETRENGLAVQRAGTRLYSDSVAYMKTDSGKKTQAISIDGIGRVIHEANAGCVRLGQLIKEQRLQSDVAVVMTTCVDWAGYSGLKAIPEDMDKRLLSLCKALLAHANRVLLVIGGPASVWESPPEWDDRVADEVALVRSWGIPCIAGDELEGAYTSPKDKLHLSSNDTVKQILHDAWSGWAKQAALPDFVCEEELEELRALAAEKRELEEQEKRDLEEQRALSAQFELEEEQEAKRQRAIAKFEANRQRAPLDGDAMGATSTSKGGHDAKRQRAIAKFFALNGNDLVPEDETCHADEDSPLPPPPPKMPRLEESSGDDERDGELQPESSCWDLLDD